MESKKNKKADLEKMYRLFLNVGLCTSLMLVILAFEWPAYRDGGLVDLGAIKDDFEEIIEITPTVIPPPPPPKIELPVIVEVPNEEEIELEIDLDLDVEATELMVIEDVVPKPKDEIVEKVFVIVENDPEFPGGMKAFYKYLSDNMKYPPQARKMSVEGRVFIQFVVDEKGNLSEVKAIKGIGAGCDEEAERVLRECPKFIPGKQRGRPVKVRMVMPIVFKLQ
ncbi:MAG: energy transducer TonB [Cyclobacteriaceae bacterium]|nr:energy transducer TonB [Cyclobacteriaceae bacterium SS2]